MADVAFIVEQFEEQADTDPDTSFINGGLIMFDTVPVFWVRHDDYYTLDIEGIAYELPFC